MESGTVLFKRPGLMRWEYESPEQKLFIVDGKTVWFYVPYDHTVTKAPVKESSDWRTPLALLTGKVELSRLCSRVDLTEQSGIPAAHALLRCLPKGTKQASRGAGSSSAQEGMGLPGGGRLSLKCCWKWISLQESLRASRFGRLAESILNTDSETGAGRHFLSLTRCSTFRFLQALPSSTEPP